MSSPFKIGDKVVIDPKFADSSPLGYIVLTVVESELTFSWATGTYFRAEHLGRMKTFYTGNFVIIKSDDIEEWV